MKVKGKRYGDFYMDGWCYIYTKTKTGNKYWKSESGCFDDKYGKVIECDESEYSAMRKKYNELFHELFH